MLRTSDLDYELPEHLVATTPAEVRDASRMMVVSRSDASRLEHRTTHDLPEYFRPGDLIVLNSTRVLRARFEGRRADTGGRVEGLYLCREERANPGTASSRLWVVLLKGSHLRSGVTLDLLDADLGATGVQLSLLERSEDEAGAWVVRAEGCGIDETDEAALERVGKTPLPPYILSARKHAAKVVPEALDRERYQTVYSKSSTATDHVPGGSVAAPTAGLHLTSEMLSALQAGGVARAEVVLHVGTGTFRKVEAEFVENHVMHTEFCSMAAETIQAVLATREAGGRVFCVGTTAARTVETYAAAHAEGQQLQLWRQTNLLITPGFRWRWTDGLLTNFHLPRSTLMALCGSLLPHGVEQLRRLYQEAIRRQYRFFSYGDAMLILPD